MVFLANAIVSFLRSIQIAALPAVYFLLELLRERLIAGCSILRKSNFLPSREPLTEVIQPARTIN